MWIDLPEQSFYLLLYLPFAIDADGDDESTEQRDGERARHHQRRDLRFILRTLLIEKAAGWFILGLHAVRPVDRQARI